MTKKELILNMKERLNAFEEGKKAPHKFTNNNVAEILEALQEIVYQGAMDEDGITIVDGLKIMVKEVPEHEGRNPRTGDAMIIPAKIKPYAKFGKNFKAAVNA